MRQDNIFVAGTGVTGESFFGRRVELARLKQQVCAASGYQKGLSITGPKHIGKSSLVQKLIDEEISMMDRTLLVQITMETSASAANFFYELALLLRQAAAPAAAEDDALREQLDRLTRLDPVSPTRDYTDYTMGLRWVLERLKALSWRLILVIDEFDRAMSLFDQPCYFGLLRSISSLPSNSLTVILLSRRQTYMIERCPNEHASIFHGAFDTFPVKEFSEDDLYDFWAALAEYDIFADEPLERALQHYAGAHPYLLSFYGNRMVRRAAAGLPVTAETIAEINRDERAWFERFYEDLKRRLEDDGHLEKLVGYLLGPSISVTAADAQVLNSMGYLTGQEDGGCCAFCPDFTEYLRKLQISLPVWDGIMGAEKVLRGFLRRAYPRLDEFRYSALADVKEWPDRLRRIYPHLSFELNGLVRKMQKNGDGYGQDSTLIDVLELSYTVSLILGSWQDFAAYFSKDGTAELAVWKPRLELIARARTQLAHAHPEYLTEQEKELAQIHCKEVLALV